MFKWLKQRFFDWAGREQQREIERLHAELVKLKAEVLKATVDSRFGCRPRRIKG